jgi:DNA-binding SARP family transcriptional activator
MNKPEVKASLLPIFRVLLFGEFTVERLISTTSDGVTESTPCYERIGQEAWGSRGPAIALFKLLLCRHRRRGMKDELVEALWPDTGEGERDKRLKNAERAFDAAASVLRRVLRTPDGASLLTNVVVGDGMRYTLAEQERLWVDADAFETLVAQALRTVDAQESLPCWEEAYRLARRGQFLEDNVYQDWAQARRDTLSGKLSECVYALTDLYSGQQRFDLARELLWEMVEAHPGDEDALYRLLLLLERQERYRAAWELYQRAKEIIEQEGLSLTPRMHKVARRLREKLTSLEPESISTAALSVGPTISTAPGAFLSATTGLLLPASALTPFHHAEAVVDSTLWFGEKLAQITTLIQQWHRRGLPCADLQRILDREITMAMKPDPTNQTYSLTRRQALVVIAALPASLLTWIQIGQASTLPMEEFLPQCAASLAACWHLMQGNEIAVVEEVLPTYLPTLVNQALQPSPSQQTAAALAAQGYLLKGLLALHRMQFSTRALYCQEAVTYAGIAQDYNLQAAALMHLGSAFYYGKESIQALQTFQQAFPLLEKVSPLLQSCIQMRMGMAAAACNQKQEAFRHMGMAREGFPAHPEDDPSSLYAEYGVANVYLVEGLAYLDLHEHHPGSTYGRQAWETFVQVGTLLPTISLSERNRVQILNYQAQAAVAIGDQDRFREYLMQGIQGANSLGSQKRRQEAIDAYKQARLVWPHDSEVQALADMFVN